MKYCIKCDNGYFMGIDKSCNPYFTEREVNATLYDSKFVASSVAIRNIDG